MKKLLLLTIFCFTSIVTQAQPTDNVVAYYPFSGNANDASGNNKNCSVSGAVLTADRLGNTNSAYLFDGVNDLIYMPTNLAFNNQAFCISFWMKSYGIHSTTDAGQTLVDFRGQYQIAVSYFQSNNTSTPNSVSFYIYSYPNSTMIYTPNNYISTNTWYHIVANYGNNTMELYINGNFIGTKTTPPAGSVYGYNNTIGKDYNVSYNRSWVYGILDEVLIYGRKLTSSEIQNLYSYQSNNAVLNIKSQPIEYAYDAVGNRISREIIVLKSTPYIPEIRDSLRNTPVIFPGDSYEELFGKDKVIIYPNPTKENLTVDIKAATTFEANIVVYDLKGTILINLTHASESNPIDFSIYPIGSYILRVQIGDKKKDWKIIKE